MQVFKKAKKFVLASMWMIIPVLMNGGGQTLVFTPTYDNLIMDNGNNTYTANTVYPNSENSVGMNHTYSYPGIYNYVAAASLIYFDLSSLAGKTVVSASLKLYVTMLAGDPAGAAARTDYKVSAISETWYANIVTWNNAPSTTYLYEKIFEVPYIVALPTVIDVTDIVKQWTNGTWTNYGLMVLDVAYQARFGNYLDSTHFGALGSASDKVPRLEVVVDENPQATFLPPIINFLLD